MRQKMDEVSGKNIPQTMGTKAANAAEKRKSRFRQQGQVGWFSIGMGQRAYFLFR
jgi:hypothetical protein